MKRPWLYYFSPSIIASIISLFIIIAGFIGYKDTTIWRVIVIFFFVPVLLILLVGDFVIKALTYGNVKRIWRIELVIVAVIIIYIITHYKW